MKQIELMTITNAFNTSKHIKLSFSGYVSLVYRFWIFAHLDMDTKCKFMAYSTLTWSVFGTLE